jgi:hypothetical protein
MMGDAAVADDDLDLAQRCYAEAHSRHPHNPRAALNLGVTLVERRRYAEALAALDDLARELAGPRGEQWVELRLAGRYNAALAHWYRSYETPAEDTTDLRDALTIGRALALDVGRMLLEPGIDAERRASLETLEGGGLALLAGIIVDAADAGVDLGEARGSVEIETPPAPGGLRAKVGLGHGPAETPAWLDALAGERWYRPGTVRVLEHAARTTHAHDPRARYNLAVLRARLLTRIVATLGVEQVRSEPDRHGLDQAFADLAAAVDRDRGHIRWARDDPLIAPLRDLDPQRFARLVPPA